MWSRNNPAAGLIGHLSCSPFTSSAACQGLWPYHPPRWFRKNPFRPLWLAELQPIHRAQRQAISSLKLKAKRHNRLGVIPGESRSGANCKVCSNHPQHGPRGSLTKLSSRTPGPFQRPGASQKSTCHSGPRSQRRCCLYSCSLHIHANFKSNTRFLCCFNS